MRRDFTKASTVEGFWRELQRGRGGHCRGVREGFCGGIKKNQYCGWAFGWNCGGFVEGIAKRLEKTFAAEGF